MAERKVSFTLSADVDPKAKQTIRNFGEEVARAKSKAEQPASSPARREQQRKEIAAIRDFEAEKAAVERAARRAAETFAIKHRKAIIADQQLMYREAVRIGKEAAAQIEAIERAKYARIEAFAKLMARRRQATESGNLNVSSYGGSSSRGGSEAYMLARGGGQQAAPVDKWATASRSIREQFSEIGESVMKVSRGVVMLGLVGEQNMDKVKDALLGVQGAFDLFGGSLKIVQKLERAWMAYSNAVGAATTAQAAHAAVANSSLAASRSIAIGSKVGAGLGITVAGGVGAGVGGAAASSGAAGSAGSVAASFGAVTASLLAALAVLKLGIDSIKGGGKIDPKSASGSVLGSIGRNAVGGSVDKYFGFKTPAAALIDSNKATGKAEQRRAMFSEMSATADANVAEKLTQQLAMESKVKSIIEQAAAIRLAGAKSSFDITGKSLESEMKQATLRAKMARTTNQNAQIELQRIAASEQASQVQLTYQKSMLDDSAKAAVLAKQMEQSQARVLSLRMQASRLTDGEKDLRDAMVAKADEESQKLIAAAQQRKAIEEGIARTRTEAARAALQASEQELSKVTDRIKQEQQSLMTAQERFGMMSREEQSGVMKVLAKARTGTQLSREEITSLKSLGTDEAERLASGNARRLAVGDYTQQNTQLQALKDEQRRIELAKKDIVEGKVVATKDRLGNWKQRQVEPGRRWENGFPRERIYSKASKERLAELTKQEIQNKQQQQLVSNTIFEDQDMRGSVFAEQAQNLGRSMQQRNMLEAKISQQINVVAKFENTANQVAEQAVGQLLKQMDPYFKDVEARLNVLTKDLGGVIDYRRRVQNGRS